MSWSFVNSSADGTNNVRSLTGLATGDLLIAWKTGGNTSGTHWRYSVPTDTAGNTWVELSNHVSPNAQASCFWWCIHNGGSSSITITMDSTDGFKGYVCSAWRNSAYGGGNVPVLTGRMCRRDPGTSTATDGWQSMPMNIVGADPLVIALAHVDGVNSTIAAGTGFNSRATTSIDNGGSGANPIILVDKLNATAGSLTPTFTIGTGTQGLIHCLSFAMSNDLPSYTTTTFSVAADSDDGSANRVAATPGGVSTGTFTDNDGSDNTTSYVSAEFVGGNYRVDEAFYRFNTGATIPAGAVVLSAELRLWATGKSITDGFVCAIAYYDYGGSPPVAADWGVPASSNNYNDYAGRVFQGDYVIFDIDTPLYMYEVDGVEPSGSANTEGFTGYTGIRLMQVAFSASGANHVSFANREHATKIEPRLIVNWYTPTQAAVPTYGGSPRRGMMTVS